MEKIFKGDILLRDNGERYLVVQTVMDFFHLCSITDGNRWTTEGLKYNSGSSAYITRAQIEDKCYRFGPFEIQSKKDFKLEVTEKREVLVKRCEDTSEVTIELTAVEVELTEVDLEKTIAHTMIQGRDGETPYNLVKRISSSIFDLLLEKGVMEEDNEC